MASYYRRWNKSTFLDFLFTFHPCLCYYKYAAIHEHMTTDFMFMFYSWNWNNSNQISIWLFNLSYLYSDHIDIQLVRVAIQKSTGKKLHLKYGLNAKEMHLRSFFFQHNWAPPSLLFINSHLFRNSLWINLCFHKSILKTPPSCCYWTKRTMLWKLAPICFILVCL